MTNDEGSPNEQMTKKCAWQRSPVFVLFEFVINSTFVIRASSFSSAPIALEYEIITDPSLRKRLSQFLVFACAILKMSHPRETLLVRC
jgi:hypothetical protein